VVCDRCGKTTVGSIMSVFNTDVICFDCKETESAHPDYEKARQAEADAVKAGNYNFEGVGLPADLLPTRKGETQ
jgi:hypothetical protein